MADNPRRKPRVREALDPVRQLRIMGRLVRRAATRPGTAPGTLVHTGPQKVERVRIRSMDYDEDRLEEREVDAIEDVLPLRDTPTVSWVNIDGLHDVELIQKVSDHFGIHPLVQEDILHVGQRPKMEEHEDHLYVVLPILRWDPDRSAVEDEQISFLLGSSWVLTFQERVGDIFEGVRERIRRPSMRIRSRAADYLLYALLDATIDHYFTVVEEVGQLTEELELEVLEDPDRETMERLHALKRELVVMRRSVTPARELVNGLLRTESGMVTQSTQVYLRDVHDHVVQVTDGVDSLRDVVAGTIDLYLSHVAHKQNEIMKVLTIMASIFIPLTFMAGVYGMNFENMPELSIPWAYPTLLAAMAVVGLVMVVFFKRKGWM